MSESERGCGPQDSIEKFTYLCHFKRLEIKGEKFKKKKPPAFILIARDVFVARAVVVAKAPYTLESDSSILVLL